ncbi:MAG TPA: helix-hairpin-helix domain-containing protein [Phycisphaerae bacterium]|nr:helix-hairpin-helix domain-containing protein [Phycisphaerae bacterium]
MVGEPAYRYDVGWNRRNTAAVLVICTLAWAGIAVQAGGRRFRGDQQPKMDGARLKAAEEKINPNTASVASLRRLPGIGEVLAKAIVDYRRKHPHEPFLAAEDLTRVRGIGQATVNRITDYLNPPW